MSEQRILVTADEAAKLLAIGRSTFWENVRKGNLPPPVKIGGATRWRAGEIQAVNEAQFLREAEAERAAAEALDLADARAMVPAPVPREPGTHHLYRHFDANGTLLYIGISLSAIQRLGEHKERSPWFWSIARVEMTAYATRADAATAERIAITTELPLHNIVFNVREAA